MVSPTLHMQGRIQFFQAFRKIAHAHSTTQRSGRTGVYESIFPEYLRKIVIHAFSYLTMLTFAKGSNTSTTSAGIFPNLVQTLTDIHAKRSKPRTLIKGIKNTDDFRITFIRCHPTGAMTTVVTDIERLVSCRSRGMDRWRGRISIINTPCLLRRQYGLGTGSESTQ